VNRVQVGGSQLLLPRARFHWDVETIEDLTMESLALVYTHFPAIEILVLGTGARTEQVPKEIREGLQAYGISIDVAATLHAISTFNILNQEGRRVAAAILCEEPFSARNSTLMLTDEFDTSESNDDTQGDVVVESSSRAENPKHLKR